jgi:NADH-quinone oxidoreductase subunit M
VGALVMLIFMRGRPSAYKAAALVTSIFTLAVAIYLAARFDTSSGGFQYQEKVSWISSLGISYHLGVDGISMLLVLLTTVLTVVAILGSWNSIKDRGLAFFISLLLLETGHHRHLGWTTAGLCGH